MENKYLLFFYLIIFLFNKWYYNAFEAFTSISDIFE